MAISLRVMVFWLLLLATLPAFAQAKTYELDLKESEFLVFLDKAGLASGLAHDHVVSAGKFTGQITYDPKKIASTKLSVVVQANSLKPDEPAVVKKYKVDNSLSAKDRKEVQTTLQGKDQLDVKKYPQITFKSRRLFKKADKKTYLSGTFTLRGVPKMIRLPVTIRLDKKGVFRGEGEFSIKQSDFGYDPFSAFFGAVKVKDKVRVRVSLVARISTKKQATPPKKTKK